MKGLLLVALGTACVVRGAYRPVRALVRQGQVRRCPGTNSFGVCDPSISVTAPAGASAYSVTTGVVALVGSDYVHVLSRAEPVVLMYQGLVPSVKAGQRVSPGQALGTVQGELAFSVTKMGPDDVAFVEPASWLASRGCRPVFKGDSDLWCGRREVLVPKTARDKCEMVLPERAGFALFPVNYEML